MYPEMKKAIEMYKSGEKVSYSTGIDGRITYGYGKLDDWGFWEFPLPFDILPEDMKKFILELEGAKNA